jgi:hypothetical protein
MTSVQSGETQLFDAELVTYRLEEAGATLLALPGTGWSTRLRASSLEIVRTAVESYGWSEKHIRPPIPSAARISRMDVDPDRPLCIAADRRRPKPGAPDHRAPSLSLASCRHRDRRRPQGGEALAYPGDRSDCYTAECGAAWARAHGGAGLTTR